jgi:allantoate deiminase
MRWAHEVVGVWMHEAGLEVRVDAVGILIGRREGVPAGGKTLLLGSHLDTVRDAGRFDGALGVLLAIACARRSGIVSCPFAIEVSASSTRKACAFKVPISGAKRSREVCATSISDCAMPMALRSRKPSGSLVATPPCVTDEGREGAKLVGYIEAHIEQGPCARSKGPAARGGLGDRRANPEPGSFSLGKRAMRAPCRFPSGTMRSAPRRISSFAAEAVAKFRRDLLATVGEVGVAPGRAMSFRVAWN